MSHILEAHNPAVDSEQTILGNGFWLCLGGVGGSAPQAHAEGESHSCGSSRRGRGVGVGGAPQAHAEGESHGCVFFFVPLVSGPEEFHGGGGGNDSGDSEDDREAEFSRGWSWGFVLFVSLFFCFPTGCPRSGYSSVEFIIDCDNCEALA